MKHILVKLLFTLGNDDGGHDIAGDINSRSHHIQQPINTDNQGEY